MILNFKLITRNLISGKRHTFLNIIGLAIGFTCALSLILWIKNEFSYDKQLPDYQRIYRLTFETRFNGNRTHFARCWEPWVSQMPGDFPQIEELVRLAPYRHTALKTGENKFYSDNIFATDSNFFKVFGLNLIYGDAESVLNKPFSAVITLSLARKCFGDKNPVGQTFLMTGEYDTKMIPFTITGVMTDSPVNSHIHFDAVTSFEKPQEDPGWAYVYLLLKRGSGADEILAGFPSFLKKVEKTVSLQYITPYLQKVTDIHLYSYKDREIEQNGNISSIYLFIIITLVLLIVSWVNFFNLNKAGLLSAQKALSIHLIMGAGKFRVISRSIIESSISVLSAFLLTLILMDWSGLIANRWFGFAILNQGISDLVCIWPFLLAVLMASVIAGSLPVINYILLNQNNLSASRKRSEVPAPRFTTYGILMTVQFCLSIILMVAAIIIYQQKKYILSKSPGKEQSDILVFKRQNWEIRSKYKPLRTKALQNPLIKNFTAAMEEPSGETMDAFNVESSALNETVKDKPLYVLSVEDNFLTFFDLKLIAGRDFSLYNPDRKGEDYILNETAVRELNWTPEEAIGRPFKIKFDTPDIFYGGTVVGVVRDFNYTSLKQDIKPYVLFQKPIFYLCYLVQVDSARKQEAIQSFKKIWEQELPDYPFQYEFLNDLYNSSYRKEFAQAKLTALFSFIAILIICFGLYSVTSVLVAQRTKEIGIRRVNGGRVSDIMFVLSSDFINWFIIAFVIACPVVFYAMQKWLQSFAYRNEIQWWAFIVAGAAVASVSLFTVSLQSWRAARRNPVEALRYE
jgi:putative ABC transport system permease protein